MKLNGALLPFNTCNTSTFPASFLVFLLSMGGQQGRTQGGCTGCTCIPLPPLCIPPPPAMCIPPSPAWKAGYEKRWGSGQQDPHYFDADPEPDPDPAQNLDADQDPDPDPDPGGGGGGIGQPKMCIPPGKIPGTPLVDSTFKGERKFRKMHGWIYTLQRKNAPTWSKELPRNTKRQK